LSVDLGSSAVAAHPSVRLAGGELYLKSRSNAPLRFLGNPRDFEGTQARGGVLDIRRAKPGRNMGHIARKHRAFRLAPTKKGEPGMARPPLGFAFRATRRGKGPTPISMAKRVITWTALEP